MCPIFLNLIFSILPTFIFFIIYLFHDWYLSLYFSRFACPLFCSVSFTVKTSFTSLCHLFHLLALSLLYFVLTHSRSCFETILIVKAIKQITLTRPIGSLDSALAPPLHYYHMHLFSIHALINSHMCALLFFVSFPIVFSSLCLGCFLLQCFLQTSVCPCFSVLIVNFPVIPVCLSVILTFLLISFLEKL